MVKYIENYALYQSIGSGVYGKVYRAINNTDKKQYAVKVIPIAKFRQNKKLQQCTVNQINILTNIEVNQHIIRYFDMLKTTNNFYFIYEYCNGGTLEGLLSRQGKLSEQSALLIFKQLLQAFQVLNKYNIMHRDLKPDNIFFHNGIIKLGDFGFCKNLNSADQMAKTMLGSPIYMAPQVLKGQIYSNKADIWSLGVVFYQMLFGHCPFQSNSIAKLIQVLNTKQLEFPQKIAQFLKDLIQKMLTKDPTKRIGWMQMFQIKISNQGTLENQKIKAISSLSDAKFSDEISGSLTSTKYTPPNMTSSLKQVSQQPIQSNYNNLTQNNPTTTVTQNQISNNHNQSPQSQYPGSQLNQNEANFKKNRNTSQSNPQVPSLNSINQSQQQTSHSQAQTNFSPNHINPNPVQNNYLQSSTNNNNLSMNQSPTSSMQISSNNANTNTNVNPLSISSSGSKIGQQHKIILEGVKLSMQIIDSRIPNYSGYAHLILTKNISNLQSLVQRPFRKQILQILDKQLKDMKNERDFVTSKMFSYQLKGLDDWKKYMRGKFFEDEKTIALWYRMVNFLNSTGSFSLNSSLNISQMAQSVKGILY